MSRFGIKVLKIKQLENVCRKRSYGKKKSRWRKCSTCWHSSLSWSDDGLSHDPVDQVSGHVFTVYSCEKFPKKSQQPHVHRKSAPFAGFPQNKTYFLLFPLKKQVQSASCFGFAAELFIQQVCVKDVKLLSLQVCHSLLSCQESTVLAGDQAGLPFCEILIK